MSGSLDSSMVQNSLKNHLNKNLYSLTKKRPQIKLVAAKRITSIRKKHRKEKVIFVHLDN